MRLKICICIVHAQYEHVPSRKNGPHSDAFGETDDTSREDFSSLFNVELIIELDIMRHKNHWIADLLAVTFLSLICKTVFSNAMS